MRKPVALAAAAALLAGLVAMASPASAACAVSDPLCSNVSFTVAAGTIALVAPAAATGGTATVSGSGATVDISLGATTVTDARVGSTGWSVSATASDFATTGGTITKSHAEFSVPADATGTGLCATRTRKSTPTAVDTNGTVAAIIACTSIGASSATYIPVLTVVVPAGSVAGTYTGTVTQSVS
jgi:hypothetical protein